MPPRKPSARKRKVGKEVKEVIEPEIKRERFSTIVEETISTNPDGFLDADRDLEYICFGSDTESETDGDLILHSLNVSILLKNRIKGDCSQYVNLMCSVL